MRDFATGWRLARRELRGGVRGLRIVLACLALGVAAIAAVGTLRASIEAGSFSDFKIDFLGRYYGSSARSPR